MLTRGRERSERKMKDWNETPVKTSREVRKVREVLKIIERRLATRNYPNSEFFIDYTPSSHT